jgi:hypothetical protein
LVNGKKIEKILEDHRKRFLYEDSEFHRSYVDWNDLAQKVLVESLKRKLPMDNLIYKRFFVECGFVPKLCMCDSYKLLKMIKSGSDPCYDCEIDKSMCKGRTYKKMFMGFFHNNNSMKK